MLMIGKTLTAEQRLEKAIAAVISSNRYRALVGVVMMGTKTVVTADPRVRTACTDGVNEYYSREFVDDLNDAELRFLLLHECKHKLYRHLFIWQPLFEEDADTASMACDYVVNLETRDENKCDNFAVMPVWTQARIARLTPEQQGIKIGDPMGLIDDKYAGMGTKQVYDLLRQDKQSREQDGGGGGNGASSGLDDHDWEAAKKLTPEQVEQLQRDIDSAIRQGAIGASKTGADVPRSLGELMQPKVDRREALREFLTEHVAGRDYTTWERPNRRFLSSGIYMPSLLSEGAGELAFCVDTSYSIRDQDLAQMLGEVTALCRSLQPSRVHILYWGSEVVRHEMYEKDNLDLIERSTNPRGGGGTYPACITKYFNDNKIAARCAVVLTDGEFYGGCGQWDVPVLWMITKADTPTPAVGKTLRL